MPESTGVEIEIEPLPPYAISDVESDISMDIHQVLVEEGILSDSAASQVKLLAERHLPTKEQLETVKILLEIAGIVGPPLLALVKHILEALKKKYGKIRVLRIITNDKVIYVPINEDNITLSVEYLKKR